MFGRTYIIASTYNQLANTQKQTHENGVFYALRNELSKILLEINSFFIILTISQPLEWSVNAV